MTGFEKWIERVRVLVEVLLRILKKLQNFLKHEFIPILIMQMIS